MNAQFDYSMYVIHSGEAIFIPAALYPIYPAVQQLRKTLIFAVIQLQKQASVGHGPSCNASKEYVYGGMYIVIS